MEDELVSDWIDALMEAFPGALTIAPAEETPESHLFAWEWFLDITSPVTRARVLGGVQPMHEVKFTDKLWAKLDQLSAQNPESASDDDDNL